MTGGSKQQKNLSGNGFRNGPPGWIYPSGITIYALMERILGGLDVGKFYDLANSPSNWLPELLAISLAGTLGYRGYRKYVNTKYGNGNGTGNGHSESE